LKYIYFSILFSLIFIGCSGNIQEVNELLPDNPKVVKNNPFQEKNIYKPVYIQPLEKNYTNLYYETLKYQSLPDNDYLLKDYLKLYINFYNKKNKLFIKIKNNLIKTILKKLPNKYDKEYIKHILEYHNIEKINKLIKILKD